MDRATEPTTIIGALTPAPLPGRLSSFVGRRTEIHELLADLSCTRLLTLTGAGGSGKTRLAIELAARVRKDFVDGVAFADLAPVSDPDAVAESIAAAFGLGARAACQVPTLIGAARLLLVIDNAEHLVDAVAELVVDYLARCQEMRVLVTSRERLNVEGELSRVVAPLQLPPPNAGSHPVTLSEYDAVELFCTRAAEHQPGFRLSPANALLVATICRHLDGIPLAIELAAARVRSLALADIVQRLNDSLGLLTNRRRIPDTRHQSLRATMDWSYQLLEEREQRLLRRLSVFTGKFDLSAVEAVCSDPDLPSHEIADVLHRLVEKSLVVTHPAEDGSLRYGLIEVVRQYGRERLIAAEEARLLARHCAHYADLVHRMSASTLDFKVRAEILIASYSNVQRAMDWAAAAEPDLEMAMVEDQQWFWLLSGAVREANARIRSVLAKERDDGPRVMRLNVQAAKWAWLARDLDAAAELTNRAAELVSGHTDSWLAARILNMRGIIAWEAGDPATAEWCQRRAIELCTAPPLAAAADNPPELEADHSPTRLRDLVMSLNDLAMIHLSIGCHEDALAQTERAMGAVAQVPEPLRTGLLAPLLDTHGSALLALGHVSEAREQLLRALSLAATNHNHQLAVATLKGLACTASVEGRHFTCIALLAAARRSALIAGAGSRKYVTPHAEAERVSRAALGEEAANAAWQQGLQMDLEAALARAGAGLEDLPRHRLALRKMQIARLVATGLTDKEIARDLLISKRTVEVHLMQLRQQLGFHNRAQVAAWAASTGLTSDQP